MSAKVLIADMDGAEVTSATLSVGDKFEVGGNRLTLVEPPAGFDVDTAANADEAEELARFDPPEMAVVDLRMPGRSGLEVTLVDRKCQITLDIELDTQIVVRVYLLQGINNSTQHRFDIYPGCRQ